MPTPQLALFAISHYCEKARWALDYYGIAYEIRYLAPGLHSGYARRRGLKKSSLPILCNGSETIQGSGAIIDWAEEHRTNDRVLCREQLDAVIATEQRLDAVLGVHIRRYFYSEALVKYPDTVRPVFTNYLSGFPRLFTTIAWSGIRRQMIKGMDLGEAQQGQSRARIEAELDWLDGLLAAGQPFLHGCELSRADITAASLIGPLIQPAELATSFQLPPLVRADVERWRSRPILTWVERVYRENRKTS